MLHPLALKAIITRRRDCALGVLLGMLGALTLSSVAGAVPISQSLVATISPAKQNNKVFGGVSLFTDLGTAIDNPATTSSPRETVFTIPKDVRFVNGNVPACPLSAIQGRFTAQAQAACPQSITGQGSVEVNNGEISGAVTFFAGGPGTIYVQTDIGPGATSLTIIGTIAGNTLTFSSIPNTPGLVLTRFATTFNKRRTGKDTFYVMARCSQKKWSTAETTTFYSGETLSASSTQKCKQGKVKRAGGKKKGGKRKGGGKKRKKPRQRSGNYVGSTTQQAVTPGFRKIRFTVSKKGRVTLTAEPSVARKDCVSTPVFTLGGTTASKKLSRNGAFTLTHTFLGTKIDKIHGKFVSTDEVEGYAVYNFSSQQLCSAGRAKVNFSAKRKR